MGFGLLHGLEATDAEVAHGEAVEQLALGRGSAKGGIEIGADGVHAGHDAGLLVVKQAVALDEGGGVGAAGVAHFAVGVAHGLQALLEPGQLEVVGGCFIGGAHAAGEGHQLGHVLEAVVEGGLRHGDLLGNFRGRRGGSGRLGLFDGPLAAGFRHQGAGFRYRALGGFAALEGVDDAGAERRLAGKQAAARLAGLVVVALFVVGGGDAFLAGGAEAVDHGDLELLVFGRIPGAEGAAGAAGGGQDVDVAGVRGVLLCGCHDTCF